VTITVAASTTSSTYTYGCMNSIVACIGNECWFTGRTEITQLVARLSTRRR